MIKICEYCNKEFTVKNGHVNQRFCSKSCGIMNRYTEDSGIFCREDLSDEIKDYILGLIVTDGCIRKNGQNKTICISLKDEELIKMIHDIACPNKKIYKDGNNRQVVWRTQKDIEYLESLNVAERKTYCIRMPKVKNPWHFMRGVFDGDGCVYIDHIHDKKYNRDYEYVNISITSGSIEFINDMAMFLEHEGVHSTIVQDKRHNGVYKINIRQRSSVKNMYEKMYENSGIWKLERKYIIFKN